MDRHPEAYQRFQKDYQRVWEAYSALGELAAQAGPLDPRTRQLVKLGMAAAQGSESAVHSHTHRALEIGLTAEEIQHALVLGVTTMGFPKMMAALTWARAAIEAHQF